MTDVTTSQDPELAELSAADEQVLRELTERASAGGLRLTGEGGLLHPARRPAVLARRHTLTQAPGISTG